MRRRCGFGDIGPTVTVLWDNGERLTYNFGTDAELRAFAYALDEAQERGIPRRSAKHFITDYRSKGLIMRQG